MRKYKVEHWYDREYMLYRRTWIFFWTPVIIATQDEIQNILSRLEND